MEEVNDLDWTKSSTALERNSNTERYGEGDSLTYRWEQTSGVGGGRVEITNADKAVATFTMPSGPAALTFNLTVTDTMRSLGISRAGCVNLIIASNLDTCRSL